MRYGPHATAFLLTALTLFTPWVATAQDIAIEPPGDREFVQDLARMVAADDVVAIREIADQLLTDTAIPIIVVTIDSMSQYGNSSWRIETFARILFDQWGIGYEDIEGQSWNRGILLLVSKNDRKARIELGADWAGEFDATCRNIMDGQIVSNFKQGNFSGGILAGVKALDNMSRGLELPQPVKPPKPPWFWPAAIGLVVLAVFTGVSLYRSGASGWAWLLWAAIFGILGFILINSLRASASGGGGGFSGGSFGGGFGGGGGATGSW